VQWLSLIKLFELGGLPSARLAQQMGLAYRTVLPSRSDPPAGPLSARPRMPPLVGGEIELDESYFGGPPQGPPRAEPLPEKCLYWASCSATAKSM